MGDTILRPREFGRIMGRAMSEQGKADLVRLAYRDFEMTRMVYFPNWQGPLQIIEHRDFFGRYTMIGWYVEAPEE